MPVLDYDLFVTHIVTQPCLPFTIAAGALTVHQLPAAMDNFVWALVAKDGSGVAAVDGPDADAVLALCERLGQPLTTVLNTHTHGDHIGINRDLQRRGLLARLRVIGPKSVADKVPGINEPVGEGDHVSFGGSDAAVWLTEGHLDGHISFVFPGAVFCGDTLFAGGCGYLFDGPPGKMHASLTRLAQLPGETRVCCAHEYTQDNLRFAWSVDPDNTALAARIRRVWQLRAQGHATVPSTIADELATNPFLRVNSLAEFTARRASKDRKEYRTIPDAQLPI
ncbi:MAG TPA: hydroxyacylglutathione hydrolase [Polyangiaceae bacterium]|nr:hydroxyacylglutathione hydrolase [Polyangiaceae bacterium]